MLYGPLKCMAKMKMCASGEDLHLQVEENKVE
jgi:hypothetical protein